MKVLDVREGFVKFEADENIFLSSFIQISGIEKNYIAQVIQMKKVEGKSIAFAKILFLYDGEIQAYDKTLPSADAEINEFTSEILQNSISVETPIIAGKTFSGNNIVIDSSAFDKRMLISVDDKSANNLIVRNLVKQFENLSKKVVIIDTLGVIEAKKITAGVDFKLPLDRVSLNFLYQDCLNNATEESKALIVEIFKDLAEYSETVPFLPFETLKTIIDDMVDKSHIFKLLVLKNKLAKLDKLGYFAKNKAEVESLKRILESKCVIIDLSKLDPVFQNRFLSFVYETLDTLENRQVILELSNVVNKKNIKEILMNSVSSTTFVTHSKFNYLSDIKNVFDNFIIEPTQSNNKIFEIYQTFLNSIPAGSYLIAGEALNYIPFVSKLEAIDEVVEINQDENEQLMNWLSKGIEAKEAETQEQAAEEVETVHEEISEENQDIDLANAFSTEVHPNNDEQIVIFDSSDEDLTEEAPQAENILEEEPQEEIAEEIIEEPEQETEEEAGEEAEVETPVEIEIIEDKEEVDEVQETEEELPPVQEEVETLEAVEENLDEEISEEEIEFETPENLDEGLTIEIDDEIDLESEIDSEELQEITLKAPEESEEDSQEIERKEIAELSTPSYDDNSEISVIPISMENQEDDLAFEEIVELESTDLEDEDILIDITDETQEETEVEEEISLDEQIVQDVDKVFSTIKEDDISDSDLDFIDELSSENDEILEEIADDTLLEEVTEDEGSGIIEDYQGEAELQEFGEENQNDLEFEPEILETKNSSTPIVPVYDADIPPEDMVLSDPIQQGETVSHAKYGTGVVEKMIKYGNKTLFSINFDNVGRRLLDPTLTEIKKV